MKKVDTLNAYLSIKTTYPHDSANVLVDKQLAILSYSAALPQWSRTGHTDLVGRPLLEIFPELVGAEASLRQLAAAQTGTLTLTRIYRPPRKKSSAGKPAGCYLNLQIEPAPGAERGLQVIITDVTQEVWLEAQLQEERQQRQLVLIQHRQIEAALQTAHTESERQAAERLDELARANSLIVALSQVASRLEKVPSPTQVMESLGAELKQLGITCFVALRDKTDEVLMVEYGSIESQILPVIENLTGLRMHGFRLSRDQFPFYTDLVDEQRPLFLPDVLVMITPALLSLSKLLIEKVLNLAGIPPGTPGLCLPLLVEEQVLGVLIVFGPSICHDDIPIFSVFAGQVAIAFENARLIAALHEDIAKRQEAEVTLLHYTTRLEILHQIDLDILTAQSPEEIAYRATARIHLVLPWQRCSVVLFDFAAGQAQALAISQANGRRLGTQQRLPLTAFNLAALQQGNYELIEDLATQAGSACLAEPLLTEGVRNYLSLPLIYQESLIGSFNLGASRPAAYTSEHIEIASEIANQLAIAIKNRQLTEEIQRYAVELEQRVAVRTEELYAANQILQQEITERKQAEALLYHSAYHDSLTKLANRTRLAEYLERALGQAKEQPDYSFALLFIDLDRFKIINDSLGHLAGDRLLTVIAQRLQANARPNDLVARLGGDEFAIVLDNLKSDAEVQELAEHIQCEIAQPVEIDGQEVITTASIGIALGKVAYEYPKDLLRDADAAMYRAKALGKARFELFEPEMHAQALNRLTLEAELRRAIERQEFVLYYQPIIALPTGQISGIEALLRWQHPQRGLLRPVEFLSVAEETGLIIPLGEWVLRTACAQTRVWHQSGYAWLQLAVNLSVYQLQHPNLLASIEEILAETGLASHQLELEITESAAIRNIKSGAHILHKLSAMGIQIATDDFGTGYSWLSFLRYLPGDKLKIGQDFIHNITTDTKEREIVAAMLTVAQRMGTTVVAEGVETAAQLAFLRQHHCDEAQGYFFYPALPAEELTGLLQSEVEGGRVYLAAESSN